MEDYKTLSELDGDGWEASTDKFSAIKDVENHKNVKYGEKLLEKYEEDDSFSVSSYTPRSIEERPRDMHRFMLSGKYLKRAEKIRKMTESDYMHVFSGEDLPVIVVFYADVDDGREYRGCFLVAPRIEEEDWK